MKLWTERRTWQSRHAQAKLAALELDTVCRIAVIKHAAFGDLLLPRPFLVTLAVYRDLGAQDVLFDLTTSTRSMIMSRPARARFKMGFFYRGWHRLIYDAALLKGAALMVGNDTEIRHLATALGTPTVGIFFSTPPFGYWPRFGHHDVVCRLDGEVPEVEEVEAAVVRLLSV